VSQRLLDGASDRGGSYALVDTSHLLLSAEQKFVPEAQMARLQRSSSGLAVLHEYEADPVIRGKRLDDLCLSIRERSPHRHECVFVLSSRHRRSADFNVHRSPFSIVICHV
jgi:hypothetical protein